MRLFIAVDCKEQKDYLKSIQDALPKHSANMKKASDFHITLKFLGKIPRTEVKNIIERLRIIDFKEFQFTLDKIGFFPNNDYIRVIWMGIKEQEDITNLQKLVDNSIKTKNNFGFKPHITLARVKQITNRQDFFNKVKDIVCEAKIIKVKSFKLMSSNLTQLGPIYETIEEFKCSQE